MSNLLYSIPKLYTLNIWGQSNAVGPNNAPPPDKYIAPIESKILQGSTFENLVYPTNNQGINGFGAELSFAYATPNCILTKKAQVGTSIPGDWFVGSANRTAFIANINKAITDYPNRDVYVYQNQWEGDINIGSSTAYYNELVAFYQGVCSNITAPIVKLIIAMPSQSVQSSIRNNVGWQHITDAFNLFAQNFKVNLINTDGIVFYDGIHYDAAGQVRVGLTLADYCKNGVFFDQDALMAA